MLQCAAENIKNIILFNPVQTADPMEPYTVLYNLKIEWGEDSQITDFSEDTILQLLYNRPPSPQLGSQFLQMNYFSRIYSSLDYP